MHSYIYGLAELNWVSESEGFENYPIRAKRFCTPAEFDNARGHLWSVCVSLDQPVYPGDITVALVTTLVSEMANTLLQKDCAFRLTSDGQTTLATCRVISVEEVDEEEHRRRSKFDVPPPEST